ncbi:MAG: hypothetical protein HY834_19470 [Devosia nanyangense]|uniref:Uncharacterized protein n=1 Tax=Devosia nanyangense TaxID=1228055 RepID=A0A933L461_9HYPH|nr:hypothetical protein [Devosia nanyangense]
MASGPSASVVLAGAALTLLLGGRFVVELMTADPLQARLIDIAWNAPIEARKVGASVDVSAKVCALPYLKRSQSFAGATVSSDGQAWSFWYWGWLHCLDPAEHRVLEISIDAALQCSATVSIAPGMCVL